MMNANRLVVALALAAAAAIVGTAAAAVFNTDSTDLATAKAATVRFHALGSATAAGYAELRDAEKIACIDLPGTGGMGVHYVNSSLVGDARLDPAKPEALVYVPKGNRMSLAALEYIVFAKAWKSGTPPAMFGRTFDYVPAGNRYGLPAFWALHAWVWKTNPAGPVMAWNPKVTCP
jgi:hypothetical protein